MTTVTLFGPPQSSYVRTARMTCVEKGIEHRLEPVDLGSDAHRALHAWGKVPILEDGSFRLIETSAICRYLDEAFPGPALTPKDPKARATMEQWISVLDCYLYEDLIKSYALQYIFPRGADGKPNREVIDPAVKRMERDLDQLERALEGHTHVVGQTLSLADLFYAPVLFTTSLFPEGKEAIRSRSNVQRLMERLVERPSFRQVQPPPR